MKTMENRAIWARCIGRSAILIMALAAITYSMICASAYIWQEELVFAPEKSLRPLPPGLALDIESVSFGSADGQRLAGCYVTAPAGGKTVILLHGNGGNISRYPRTLAVLHSLGHGVLAFDYRGYGESSGSPTERGTYLDAAGAYDYLVGARGVAPTDIVAYGRSLGGGVATWLATARPLAALILESTFTRMADMGALRYPWLPSRWLTRIQYDSLSRIPLITCPILVAHGRDDALIPEHFGRRLAAAGRAIEFVSLPGGHNDAFLRAGPSYYARLDHFVRAAKGG
jgi:fermentation-respiration switch protein FrsA (DUF1100 family)